jgi:membrane protein YdbS with pleckstrin-like domain
MKLNKKYSTLLTLIILSLIALLMLYLSISFIQLTFNIADWWVGSRLAIIIFWVVITLFMGMNLYSEDD